MIPILQKLEKITQSMFNWFSENFLKTSSDKHLLVSSSEVLVGIQIYSIKVTSESRFKPLSANFAKWSNTFKQFVGSLPKNCLSVFDHFVGLTLIGLSSWAIEFRLSY